MITADGVQVPRIGFGTWELTGDTAYQCVRDALDVGYRHVDTARIYGNEVEVGRAIADSDVDRDDVFVTTKVWFDDAAPADVGPATEASLGRLGLDHVDLLLIHWPSDVASVEATVEALAEQAALDRTRLIGVSNHTRSQYARARAAGPVVTNQVEHHVLLDQSGLLADVRAHGGFLSAFSPLAHGELLDDPTLEEVAAGRGCSVAQLALAWLLAEDDVVVLPRSSSRDHIADNLGAASIELTDEERATLDALPKDHRTNDPPFAPDWD